MLLNHDIAGFIKTNGPYPNTFAGSALKNLVTWIIVDPPTQIDNGEFSTGQCVTKISLLHINVYSRKNTLELEPIITRIKQLLQPRQFALTQHRIQAAILQSEMITDMRPDPEGLETGLPSAMLIYKIAHRRL